MAKIEEYIKDNTRTGINTEVGYSNGETALAFTPWLTPEDAMAVAKIAREEVIKKVVEWIKSNIFLDDDEEGNLEWVLPFDDSEEMINNFKKSMEGDNV